MVWTIRGVRDRFLVAAILGRMGDSCFGALPKHEPDSPAGAREPPGAYSNPILTVLVLQTNWPSR